MLLHWELLLLEVLICLSLLVVILVVPEKHAIPSVLLQWLSARAGLSAIEVSVRGRRLQFGSQSRHLSERKLLMLIFVKFREEELRLLVCLNNLL